MTKNQTPNFFVLNFVVAVIHKQDNLPCFLFVLRQQQKPKQRSLVFGYLLMQRKKRLITFFWQLLFEKALILIINVRLKFFKTKGICSIVLMTKNTLIVSGASLQTRVKMIM